MQKRRKRRLIKVEVTLSLAPGVTAAQARKELRSRINDGCEYHSHWDWPENAVRMRKAKGVR